MSEKVPEHIMKEVVEQSTYSSNIKAPKVRSRLCVNGFLYFDFIYEMPNVWWRLWQWLLLGWKWEKVK